MSASRLRSLSACPCRPRFGPLLPLLVGRSRAHVPCCEISGPRVCSRGQIIVCRRFHLRTPAAASPEPSKGDLPLCGRCDNAGKPKHRRLFCAHTTVPSTLDLTRRVLCIIDRSPMLCSGYQQRRTSVFSPAPPLPAGKRKPRPSVLNRNTMPLASVTCVAPYAAPAGGGATATRFGAARRRFSAHQSISAVGCAVRTAGCAGGAGPSSRRHQTHQPPPTGGALQRSYSPLPLRRAGDWHGHGSAVFSDRAARALRRRGGAGAGLRLAAARSDSSLPDIPEDGSGPADGPPSSSYSAAAATNSLKLSAAAAAALSGGFLDPLHESIPETASRFSPAPGVSLYYELRGRPSSPEKVILLPEAAHTLRHLEQLACRIAYSCGGDRFEVREGRSGWWGSSSCRGFIV